MVKIYIFEKENKITEEITSNLLFSLPKVLQEDILNIQHPTKRTNSLISKALLRYGLQEFGYGEQIKYLDQNDKKPKINKAPHFNISHSGDIVICAMSIDSELGIDIEKVKDIEIENFSKVLSEQELDDLKKSNNKNHDFFDLWTKKEAILKADGKGLIPMLMRNIILNNDYGYLPDEKKWYLSKLNLKKGYICHLATTQFLKKDNNEIHNIELTQILTLSVDN